MIGVRTRDLPTRFSRSANCATEPTTCWNTIPACQPDRGLSAAIYIQQHDAESLTRRLEDSESVSERDSPRVRGPWNIPFKTLMKNDFV
jgi:hypothetical protein